MKLNEAKQILKNNGYLFESYASSKMKMSVKQILASKYHLNPTEVILATIDEDEQMEEAANEGIMPSDVAESIYKKFMRSR